MRQVEDVLNQPRVAAWMLKGLMKECERLSIEDMMDVYVPKTHRYVSYSSERKCWVYDLDVPLNVNAEDLSSVDTVLYDKARSQLLLLNADFYAIAADDIRRGYRVIIVFSKDLDVSYVEEEDMVIAFGEVQLSVEFAHFVTIHVGNRAEDHAPGYVKMLTALFRVLSSSEELESTYGIRV